jgi:hypothetical protein
MRPRHYPYESEVRDSKGFAGGLCHVATGRSFILFAGPRHRHDWGHLNFLYPAFSTSPMASTSRFRRLSYRELGGERASVGRKGVTDIRLGHSTL